MLLFVIVTVYTPLMAVVTLVRLGFCALLVKLAGPLQLYVYVGPLGVAPEVKLIVPPEHTTGVVVPAVATGLAFTVMLDVEPVAVQPAVLVTVTV